MNKRLWGGIIAAVSFIITLTGCNADLENSSAFESEEFFHSVNTAKLLPNMI